jgi:hypothetical protein
MYYEVILSNHEYLSLIMIILVYNYYLKINLKKDIYKFLIKIIRMFKILMEDIKLKQLSMKMAGNR